MVLARGRWSRYWPAVLSGAVIPDAPMFIFFLWEKFVVGHAEDQIWSQSYFQPAWQNSFDLFNSLPLIAIAIGISAWRRGLHAVALFASMAAHCVADLLLHHDDAHRHFLPFSQWRFRSPVSYWDPRYYGQIFSLVELVLVLVCVAMLLGSARSLPLRLVAGGILLSYGLYWTYGVLVWAA